MLPEKISGDDAAVFWQLQEQLKKGKRRKRGEEEKEREKKVDLAGKMAGVTWSPELPGQWCGLVA